MKKKIAALILLSLFSVIALAGCSADTTPIWQTDKSAPWYNNNRYERIEYSFSRNTVETVDSELKTGYEIADGKYVTEMIGIKNLSELDGIIPYDGLSLTENSNYSYTLLKTILTVDYNDAAGAMSGTRDVLESSLLFYTIDMLPIYAVKKADYGSTGTKYEIKTDYKNLTNTGFILEDGETKDFDTEVDKNVGSTVFDSSLLYHAARARTVTNASFNFSVYSPTDSAKYNEKKTFDMIFETGSAISGSVDKEDKFIKNCFTKESMPERSKDKNDNIDGYIIPSIYARMRINATKTGINTHLFYSAEDFNIMGMTMSKVLLSMQKDEYDAFTSTATYRNIYRISDYSISR